MTAADKEQLPKTIKAAGPDGPVTVNRVDVYRRMPAMEAFLASVVGVPVAAVWAFVHGISESGQRVRAVAAELDGRPHVFLNTLRARCPVVRLALVGGHEAEHIRNGDTRRPGGYDAKQEAACESAAGEVIGLACKLAKRRGATVAVDAATCRACYQAGSLPCSAGTDVFSEVQRVLSEF